jgi:hypothetical protein
MWIWIHTATPIIFLTMVPNTYIWWRKDSLFNKCYSEKWLSACRKLKLDPCLSLCTSINSKWIKDLNIRTETFKLGQERAGIFTGSNRYRQEFLSRTEAAQQLRESIDKWNYVKFKSFYTTKKVESKLKRPPTGWEKNLCQLYIKQGTDKQNV